MFVVGTNRHVQDPVVQTCIIADNSIKSYFIFSIKSYFIFKI